jgi:hypothetical protein
MGDLGDKRHDQRHTEAQMSGVRVTAGWVP